MRDGDAGLVDVEWCECSAVEKKWDDGSRGGKAGGWCKGMWVLLLRLMQWDDNDDYEYEF